MKGCSWIGNARSPNTRRVQLLNTTPYLLNMVCIYTFYNMESRPPSWKINQCYTMLTCMSLILSTPGWFDIVSQGKGLYLTLFYMIVFGLEPLLLTWVNFNISMDKNTYPVGLNYLSIVKQQGLHVPLKFGNWYVIHSTLYNGCNQQSMLGLKVIHDSKRSPWLPCPRDTHPRTDHCSCALNTLVKVMAWRRTGRK